MKKYVICIVCSNSVMLYKRYNKDLDLWYDEHNENKYNYRCGMSNRKYEELMTVKCTKCNESVDIYRKHLLGNHSYRYHDHDNEFGHYCSNSNQAYEEPDMSSGKDIDRLQANHRGSRNEEVAPVISTPRDTLVRLIVEKLQSRQYTEAQTLIEALKLI
jgi:hypothetical protein